MSGDATLRSGYLLVADISGYTAFLTASELEHAQAIVEELTTQIVATLTPTMQLVKLEGDAVLCRADANTVGDAERLVDLIESCYVDFSDRLLNMERSTTCRCAACASMHALDLKFIAHFGTYVIQHVAGHEDVAGPDVILLHYLLKNSIRETTGVGAYVFFTASYLAQLPHVLDLPAHEETYESLGRVRGGIHDLKPVLEAMRERRREYISADQADFSVSVEIDAQASVLWEYWIDPEKRLRWQTDMKSLSNDRNASARMGVGAVAHCAHGSWGGMMCYVDWRPFRYFTDELRPTSGGLTAAPAMTETVEFVPTSDGLTEMHYRNRCNDWRGRIKMRLFAPIFRRIFQHDFARLRKLISEGDQAAGL